MILSPELLLGAQAPVIYFVFKQTSEFLKIYHLKHPSPVFFTTEFFYHRITVIEYQKLVIDYKFEITDYMDFWQWLQNYVTSNPVICYL